MVIIYAPHIIRVSLHGVQYKNEEWDQVRERVASEKMLAHTRWRSEVASTATAYNVDISFTLFPFIELGYSLKIPLKWCVKLPSSGLELQPLHLQLTSLVLIHFGVDCVGLLSQKCLKIYINLEVTINSPHSLGCFSKTHL